MRSKSCHGFSLIELVVSVGIISLLVGGGIAVFSMFRSKRMAINDAQVVANTLRDAHRRALAGAKPNQCTGFELTGYQVSLGATDLTLVADCSGGNPDTETISLSSSGRISGGTNQFKFVTITGGTTNGSVDICTMGNRYRITVTSAGSISDPVEVPGGC